MATFPTEEKVSFQFPAGLRVVAVDEGPTNLEVIKQISIRCHYCTTTFSDAPLALNYVREKKDCIDVILVEVHMPNMDGYEFLQHVTDETNVPVIMMSLDNSTSTVMKAIIGGACDYWTKPLIESQFKTMWEHLARKLWRENKLPKEEDSEFVASFSVLETTVRGPEKIGSNFKDSDSDEPGDSLAPSAKKQRVIWSQELHHQFVNAVMQIGLDKAQPKRILAVMNNPGLTREQVASHLQKYRHDLLNTSNGVTLQQNEKALPNSIESRGRDGMLDLTAFGDTNHVPYAPLHPEEVASNLMPHEDQRPNHSREDQE